MKTYILSLGFVLFYAFTVQGHPLPTSENSPKKPRIVITTDPELDDLNSLLRFLLYSTDFEVEGLIYASSQFHWKGDGKGTKLRVPGREYTRFGLDMCPCESWRWNPEETFIHDAVEAYAAVYANLKVHHTDYPHPDSLRSKIRFGNVEFDGDISKDSPGSELIRELILDKKPGPLYLSAWGGHSTIARALKSIQDEFKDQPEWESIKAKISAKVILLPSGDQDNTYETYIRPNWPDIPYHQVQDGPNYGFMAPLGASTQDSLFLTAAWTRNFISRQGPIGAMYRVWGDGKQMVRGDIFDFFGVATEPADSLRKKGYVVWMPLQEPGAFISEGDTGTFMNLLNNGLQGGTYPEFGGWGGRILPGKEINDPFAIGPDISSTKGSTSETTSTSSDLFKRIQQELAFFPVLQWDFANRIYWSVTNAYAAANHNPELVVTDISSNLIAPDTPLKISVMASDPDLDELELVYHLYTNHGQLVTSGRQVAQAATEIAVKIPDGIAQATSYHLILELKDSGKIPLSKYGHLVFLPEHD